MTKRCRDMAVGKKGMWALTPPLPLGTVPGPSPTLKSLRSKSPSTAPTTEPKGINIPTTGESVVSNKYPINELCQYRLSPVCMEKFALYNVYLPKSIQPKILL